MIVDIGGQLFPLNISAEVLGGLLRRFILKGENVPEEYSTLHYHQPNSVCLLSF